MVIQIFSWAKLSHNASFQPVTVNKGKKDEGKWPVLSTGALNLGPISDQNVLFFHTCIQTFQLASKIRNP